MIFLDGPFHKADGDYTKELPCQFQLLLFLCLNSSVMAEVELLKLLSNKNYPCKYKLIPTVKPEVSAKAT